jgi:hypothetical protein
MAAWEVEITNQFRDWWDGLTADQQESVTDRVLLLADRGPALGRPVVDRVHSSRHHNMKELRAAKDGVLRVLFMFDPRSQVICCLAGTRAGRGTSGTAGPCRRQTTCTTSIWPSCVRKG